jgi:hypothetical protein
MPINESNTVQYTVTTTNTADGTTLYWKTTGNTNNADIVGGNTGSITITNNQAIFNVTMNSDVITDGTKTLGISVLTGSVNGTSVVNTANPIIVNDSSQAPVQVPLTFLAVAGGGGGSFWGGYFYGSVPGGSGGGAGGYITRTVNVLNSNVYTITVGAGGAGGWESFSQKGTNTSISGTQLSNTAFGGGPASGPDYNTNGTPPHGSGGGSSSAGYASTATAGQGNNGATVYGGNGGGGGGAGAAATTSIGGIGLQNSITGNNSYYAGGGGGGGDIGGGAGSVGGFGGGGTGGTYNFTTNRTGPGAGQNGTTNTGGGAGGGTGGQGGTGGSGVFILSVPTIYYSGTYTGSNVAVTTSGANTVLSFYSSGTYTS